MSVSEQEVNIQETFNKVISAGYYNPAPHDKRRSDQTPYMCLALVVAKEDQVITYPEKYEATNAIEEYLGGCDTLRLFLEKNKLDYSPGARLAVYTNWNKRPKPRSFSWNLWHKLLGSGV